MQEPYVDAASGEPGEDGDDRLETIASARPRPHRCFDVEILHVGGRDPHRNLRRPQHARDHELVVGAVVHELKRHRTIQDHGPASVGQRRPTRQQTGEHGAVDGFHDKGEDTQAAPRQDGPVRALLFDGQAPRLTVDHPSPVADGDFAVVRTVLAGICNTDLEILRGYMGFSGVLGHELVGVVEDGPPALVGERVVAEINFACGHCEACERALGRHCPHRTVMGISSQDGAFAERVAIPVANLHVVPDEVPDETAVFAEPLAAAFEIREQLRIPSGTETTVLGDGKLGLLVAMVLHDAGARVLLVGKHSGHLDIAAGRGVSVVHLDDWDRTARDLTVDATGNAAGFAMALAATRPRGTLVLKSTVAEELPAALAQIVIHEITVIGSRCGPFAPALAALASGAIDPREMIAGEHGLDDAVAALAHAGTRGTLKVLLRP